MVKCLGPHTFTTVGVGLIPAWGTNILQALWHSQKNKKIPERSRKQNLNLPHAGNYLIADILRSIISNLEMI